MKFTTAYIRHGCVHGSATDAWMLHDIGYQVCKKQDTCNTTYVNTTRVMCRRRIDFTFLLYHRRQRQVEILECDETVLWRL